MTQTADIPVQPTADEAPTYIPVAEVCRLTGATYRQIDYWCRQDYISGHEGQGSGSSRRWTVEDVEYLTVFVKLVNAGLELKCADMVMKQGLIMNGMVRLSDDIVLVFEPVVPT